MIHMNLQYFGGRGGAGGKRTSSAGGNADIISSAASKAAKDWGDSYVPLSEKETKNMNSRLEKFDSDAFKTQEFKSRTEAVKQKIEGIPGQFRFIDTGTNDKRFDRYLVDYVYGGVTHAVGGKTKKQALAKASKEFKAVTVREALYKKRKK